MDLRNETIPEQLRELPWATRWPLIWHRWRAYRAGIGHCGRQAGALGSLPCAMLSADAMQRIGRNSRSSRRAVQCEFLCHTPPQPDALREVAWRAALSPYYAEYGIDAATIPCRIRTQPVHAGGSALAEFKPRGGVFISVCRTGVAGTRACVGCRRVVIGHHGGRVALWLEAHGADAIIAQGVEAGGHRGMFLSRDLSTQRSTWELLPAIVAAVKVPVIAAGGTGMPVQWHGR